MPFARQTLSQLRQQAQQDVLSAGIPGIDGFLAFSVLSVVTWVQAMFAWLHYGYLDYIAKQAVPWTATDEFLAGWGTLKRVSKKPAAAAASTSVAFPATAIAVMRAGTSVVRSDGWTYVTTADSVVSAGLASAPVISVTAGAAGNTPSGTIAALGSPVSGVQTSGSFTAAATGGADIESDDAFRGRVIAAYQALGSDGNSSEYAEWATAVPGVTRAWVARNGAGPGSVVVYFMLDDAEAANGGFPVGTDGAAAGEPRYTTATGDQLTVADAIYPLQPVTALVCLASPVRSLVEIELTTASAVPIAMQAQIKQALADLFLRIGTPLGVTIYPGTLSDAISTVPGMPQFTMTAPTGSFSLGIGLLPVIDTITFVS